MSSFVNKYKIVYDGNDGMTYEKFIYCKFENVWHIKESFFLIDEMLNEK